MAQTTAYKPPGHEDIVGCQFVLFEWAESYDSKDWGRLAKCVAPTLHIDYSSVMGQEWKSMPADDFVALASSPKFLGNARIKTQHFIGASQWVQRSEDAIIGYHQMRVAHQKYSDDTLTEVLAKGHAHGKATIKYQKVDGVWKFAGLEPDIRWGEFDVEKIFHE
ncbi:Scytalone dehydratase [Talaromyces atroroseus]|uniref:Scytalone dehydratase n=1 Tax=Talaromyces atroroseus TaxID=1441469 RepID=A0A1Q5Q672_TALAT|nr:Scytalone dehydratase [Talaromyces atroroseus]OKL55332.1 Scytalone dehydratase [Talaromyces atroroseus]